jgi:hypothetical protein
MMLRGASRAAAALPVGATGLKVGPAAFGPGDCAGPPSVELALDVAEHPKVGAPKEANAKMATLRHELA